MSNHNQAHDRTAVVARHQRRQFRAMAEGGQVGAVDRFGMPIQVGDLVVVELGMTPTFQVVDIVPNLQPNVPPGTITVVVTTTIPMMTQANQALRGLVVVRPAEVDGDEPQDGGDDV